MAVTDEQKIDFLLKKIGYTKTKTGSLLELVIHEVVL